MKFILLTGKETLMNVDEYVDLEIKRLLSFKKRWKEGMEDSENFPEHLDSEADWLDQYLMFYDVENA